MHIDICGARTGKTTGAGVLDHHAGAFSSRLRSTSFPSLLFRSRLMDFLLRLHDMK
jgi:hypothetical protein